MTGGEPDGAVGNLHIAVTGEGGFIGSHLSAALRSRGARVTPLGPTDDPPVGVQAVVHLGYRFPRELSHWARLAEELNSNVAWTARLLSATSRLPETSFCFASSASVYAAGSVAATEDGCTEGDTPYAIAKLQQEHMVADWGRKLGRPAAVMRLATVYGPGETVPRAIPNFIRAALDDRLLEVDSAGFFEPVYVYDVAHAFAIAIERGASGIFNVGTGVGVPALEVAEEVVRQAGSGRISVRARAQRQRRPICQVAKAEACLGFRAQTSLATGLRAEIAWFRERGASAGGGTPAEAVPLRQERDGRP